MSEFDLYEEYYYDDPDNEYTYQDSSVLRNKYNIREFEELMKQEYQLVRTKALDIYIYPILVHLMKDVCKIHFMLFSELYEWAGNYRKVNISNKGRHLWRCNLLLQVNSTCILIEREMAEHSVKF